jgi:hypothetical protein
MHEAVVLSGYICAWTSERLWILLLQVGVLLKRGSRESEGLVDGDNGCVEEENGKGEKQRHDEESGRNDLIAESMRWIGSGSEGRKEIEFAKILIASAEIR